MAGKTSLTDFLHISLMLAALGLAYILPFQLVLLAYAILGPIHYLTEISWLHERSYFLARRALVLILITITGCLVYGAFTGISLVIIAALYLGALAFSAAFALQKRLDPQFAILFLSALGGILLVLLHPKMVLLAFLLPTLVHVSLFTFIFMLTGALKSKHPMQFVLLGLYVLSLSLILLLPPTKSETAEVMAVTSAYFGSVGAGLGQLFGTETWPISGRLAGVLSFVYTYHYCNWFLKVNIINWHRVSKRRLIAICVLSAAATSIYFYNYALGFTVLFSLSLLHVILEFPLNILTTRQLIGFLRKQPAT